MSGITRDFLLSILANLLLILPALWVSTRKSKAHTDTRVDHIMEAIVSLQTEGRLPTHVGDRSATPPDATRG